MEVGRTRPLEGIRGRLDVRDSIGGSGSRAGAAARHQSNEQFRRRSSGRRDGRDPLVARLADLAAGPPAHVRVFHLIWAPPQPSGTDFDASTARRWWLPACAS